MPCGKVEHIPDLVFGIQVGAGRLGGQCRICQREIDAAGVDESEFEQAAFDKRFDMGVAGGYVCKRGIAVRHECRVGGIDGDIHLIANAFDDARIYLPVVGLRAAAVIGVGVNDGGAGARAGDALGDDRLNRIGNARLKPAAPWAVYRGLDPDLVDDEVSKKLDCPPIQRRALRDRQPRADVEQASGPAYKAQ